MSVAAAERAPLLGTAIRSRSLGGVETIRSSQVRVDVVEGQSGGQHQHLGVVEQLADLLGGALLALVLGGHPRLGGLLDELLADRVHAGVELGHGAGALGPALGPVGQLGPQLLERLHEGQPSCRLTAELRRVQGGHMSETAPSPTPFEQVVWPVRTERLSIRPVTADDFGRLYEIRAIPEVTHWLTGRPTSYDDYVDRYGTRARLDSTLVVELDGTIIGDLFLGVET